MSFQQKAINEIKTLGLLTFYFAVWFEMIVFVKWLVLAEDEIKFRGTTIALVGALVFAKVVLVLEHISLGQWVRRRPVVVDVALRTLIYSIGVLILLVLERALEVRHQAGGLGKALVDLFHHREIHHAWAETICVSGSLLGFNVLSALKRHFGGPELRRLFLATPLADLEIAEKSRASVATAKSVP